MGAFYGVYRRRHTLPRRKKVVRRPDIPDAKYKSRNVVRFIGKLMMSGKRSLAERIIYDAFDLIENRQKRAPLDVFEQAVKNATPTLEVKPRRVGGSTYQVPIDRSEEHTSELQSHLNLVCRLLLEKKKINAT